MTSLVNSNQNLERRVRTAPLSVFQDVVESGNAIGSHHDKAVTNVVDFADFTRLKGFIFLHDTSSLYFGILIIAQGTLFVE